MILIEVDVTFCVSYLKSVPFGRSYTYKNANIDTVSVNISVLMP